jgi:mannose-6-phosphate isomerase
MCNVSLLDNPLFFDKNRVWRCYRGGKLLDDFLNESEPFDGNFPEEWLGSTTSADNDNCQQSPDEGLSRIRATKIFFRDLLKRFPLEAMGKSDVDGFEVLCKFLDSAIRLPIQCHPDQKFAYKYCNSKYGKTESWIILATRKINGESPYILMGFKPGVTKAEFKQAVNAQNLAVMTDCLHKFYVKPGEVYFIPGRIPHAIGPGLLLLEVQEPTDLVIQPEQRIGNIALSEKQMWGELDHDTGFSCFNYAGIESEKLIEQLKIKPKTIKKDSKAVFESIIGNEHTDCFNIDKLTITKECELSFDLPWYLGIVTLGTGILSGEKQFEVKPGDSFFISNKIKKIKYSSLSKNIPLEIYIVSKK